MFPPVPVRFGTRLIARFINKQEVKFVFERMTRFLGNSDYFDTCKPFGMVVYTYVAVRQSLFPLASLEDISAAAKSKPSAPSVPTVITCSSHTWLINLHLTCSTLESTAQVLLTTTCNRWRCNDMTDSTWACMFQHCIVTLVSFMNRTWNRIRIKIYAMDTQQMERGVHE